MSYAGPSRATATGHRATRTTTINEGRTAREGGAASYSASPLASRAETDWQEVALFGAGLMLGVILGAGGALLTAPRTGAETRAALGARAARFRRSTSRRTQNAWDDLNDELRQAKRALKRRKMRKRERELED